MVTVEVLKSFYDLKVHESRAAGTTFECSGERATQIEAALPGYIAVRHEEVEEEPAKDLSKMTVAQLRAMCDELGIGVPKSAKKAQLIEAISKE